MTFSDQAITLTFGQISQWPFKVNDTSFNASRQKEHDAVKINGMPLLTQKLLPKHFS